MQTKWQTKKNGETSPASKRQNDNGGETDPTTWRKNTGGHKRRNKSRRTGPPRTSHGENARRKTNDETKCGDKRQNQTGHQTLQVLSLVTPQQNFTSPYFCKTLLMNLWNCSFFLLSFEIRKTTLFQFPQTCSSLTSSSSDKTSPQRRLLYLKVFYLATWRRQIATNDSPR